MVRWVREGLSFASCSGFVWMVWQLALMATPA